VGSQAWRARVAISSGEPRVITASYDKTVRLWDPAASHPDKSWVVLNHDAGINAIAVSANGRYLVTGTSYDYKATLWMVQTGDLANLARAIAGRELTNDELQDAGLK